MNALPAQNGTQVQQRTSAPRFEEFVLKRTGQRPLRFQGTRIGFGTTKRHASPEWTNVAIYKTAAGRYIADIEHGRAYPAMSEISETLAAECVDELIAATRGLDLAARGACTLALQNALAGECESVA
jgi:hypothetical protein